MTDALINAKQKKGLNVLQLVFVNLNVEMARKKIKNSVMMETQLMGMAALFLDVKQNQDIIAIHKVIVNAQDIMKDTALKTVYIHQIFFLMVKNVFMSV